MEPYLQVGAHEVLADLLMRYTSELSSTSHSYAELAGRTATNICDVVRSQSPHASRSFIWRMQAAVTPLAAGPEQMIAADDLHWPPSANALVQTVRARGHSSRLMRMYACSCWRWKTWG